MAFDYTALQGGSGGGGGEEGRGRCNAGDRKDTAASWGQEAAGMFFFYLPFFF
jgi:hypothetical protein